MGELEERPEDLQEGAGEVMELGAKAYASMGPRTHGPRDHTNCAEIILPLLTFPSQAV